MSKVTNPSTESSVTAGFFNAIKTSDGFDRTYTSEQISEIFDGVINDGIYAGIGEVFVVKALSGNTVTIGTGRAWFDHVWVKNDAKLPVTLPDSEVVLNRYDAVVIETDHNISVRDACIKIVKGTPSSAEQPEYPTLTSSEKVNQHVLAYIYRKADSTSIDQADITNCIGTDSTPFVTAIIQCTSLDILLGQWQAQLNNFVASEEKFILDWFERVKGLLEPDAAAHLAASLATLELYEIYDTGEITVDPVNFETYSTGLSGFNYRVSVPISGLTTTDLCQVAPSQELNDLGILSVQCDSYADVLYLYADSIPESPITIKNVSIRRRHLRG